MLEKQAQTTFQSHIEKLFRRLPTCPSDGHIGMREEQSKLQISGHQGGRSALQQQLSNPSPIFDQHLNILHPRRAFTLLLNPRFILLSLWLVARKPFDDVDSQEGVSNGQHQAAAAS